MSSQPRPPTHRLQGPGAHLQEARGRQPGRELRPRAQEPPRTAPSLPWSREPGLPSSQDSGPTPDAAATPLPWPAGGQAGPGSTRSPSEVGRTRLCPPAQTQVPWALFGREPPLAQAQACCPPRGAAWRPGSGSALTPRGLGLGLPSAAWLPGVGPQPHSCPSWFSALLSCRSRGRGDLGPDTWACGLGLGCWLGWQQEGKLCLQEAGPVRSPGLPVAVRPPQRLPTPRPPALQPSAPRPPGPQRLPAPRPQPPIPQAPAPQPPGPQAPSPPAPRPPGPQPCQPPVPQPPSPPFPRLPAPQPPAMQRDLLKQDGPSSGGVATV